MNRWARSVKVWMPAHVGSDGKLRPCPDNHARLKAIDAFACSCGGKDPVILSGTVRVTVWRASTVTLEALKRTVAAMGARL